MVIDIHRYNSNLTELEDILEKNIIELIVSNNLLASLPVKLFTLNHLRILNLSGNRLTDVKGISKLHKLEQLDVSNNLLTDLHKCPLKRL